MMLTGQKELIAIVVLILYIAFIPNPYALKQFFATPVGKVVALGVFVYALKNVSPTVALLLLVNYISCSATREYLESKTGMTPPSTSTENNFKCPDEYVYNSEKKTCMKGDESKPPQCIEAGATFEGGKCMSKPGEMHSSAGPPGGTTPGAMAIKNELANMSSPPTEVSKEGFSPYGGGESGNFAPA